MSEPDKGPVLYFAAICGDVVANAALCFNVNLIFDSAFTTAKLTTAQFYSGTMSA